MRDEYDFKDAVKGKYAARFHAGPVTIHRLGSDDDLIREAVKHYLADALAASQIAEFELFFLLSLEGFFERSRRGAQSLLELLSRPDEAEQSLGSAWQGAEAAWRDFARCRNWLVHHSLLSTTGETLPRGSFERLEQVSRTSRQFSAFLRERLSEHRAKRAEAWTDLERDTRAVWLQAA